MVLFSDSLCRIWCRAGCATSEDMLWKLDALQTFIRELHWPEEVFAEHLEHRLKLMASDMIEAAASRYSRILIWATWCFSQYIVDVLVQCKSTTCHVFFCARYRTLKAFELWLKRGSKSTDYLVPTEMLVMINVVIDFKNQVSSFAIHLSTSLSLVSIAEIANIL